MSFSRHAKSICPEEVTQFRQTLIRLCSLMHGSALDDIGGRSEDNYETLPSYETIDVLGLDKSTLRFLRDCKVKYGWNKVCALQHMIQVLITHNLQIGVLDIPPPILSRVYQTLSRGFVNLLNAVKITDTNFPFPWAQLIYLLLVVHSMFTPLIVAAQLEKPFGTDDNDLPLTFFQTEFNQSLLLLMHEMADHLPSTLPNSKTSVDDLRRSSMARSDSKVFETMTFDVDPEILVLEVPHDVPKLEEKATEKAKKFPTENEKDPDCKLELPLVESQKLHEAEIVDIVTMCKESLMILSQSLPAALQQHCEAIDKFREAVPQLLSPPRVSEVSEVSNEGIRSV